MLPHDPERIPGRTRALLEEEPLVNLETAFAASGESVAPQSVKLTSVANEPTTYSIFRTRRK